LILMGQQFFYFNM